MKHFHTKEKTIIVFMNLLLFAWLAQAQEWDTLGVPNISGQQASSPSIALYNGVPYLAQVHASSQSGGFQIRKYNGFTGTWDIAYNPTQDVRRMAYLDLEFTSTGVPFCVSGQSGPNSFNRNRVTRIMSNFTTSWRIVGTASKSFPKQEDKNHQLEIGDNDTVYVAYTDQNAGSKVTVKKQDGTNWVAVGTENFSDSVANYLSMAMSPAKVPYVAYSDLSKAGKVTVMKYNGTAWDSVGIKGITPGGVNGLKLTFGNDETPYLAFTDLEDSRKIKAMKYDGTNWINIGDSVSSVNCSLPVIQIYNNEPYVAYQDRDNSLKVTVRKYNGTNWELVGQPGFSTGYPLSLDFTIDQSNGLLYVIFKDNSNGLGTTVMRYGCAPSSSTQDIVSCTDYVSPSGKTWTTSGTYEDTITNEIGCDSLMTINLSIIQEDRSLNMGSLDICENQAPQISVPQSLNGVDYYLRKHTDSSVIAGPFVGKGNNLVLMAPTSTSSNTYHVTQSKRFPVESNGIIRFYDGNDEIKTTTATNLPAGNSPFTVEAWVNRTANNFSSGILGWGNINDGLYSITGLRLENNGHLQLRWRLKEFSVDAGNTAGTWNHVAASYDGTNVKLYLNGVLLKSFVSNKVHNVVSPNILVIGSDPEGRDLIGKLDEVRIWDDVRTIDELIANMNLTLEGNEENLVAYYNFEDGAGTTLTDQTVNGNDATLINMAPTRDWQKANGFLSSKCSYQLSQTAQVTVSSLSSINQTLTVRNDSVISNEQNGDSYQWQNCTGTSTDIIGETNDKLKAPSSGDYSVVITKGACTITSNCEPVIISGINKNANNGVVKLYPNPTSSYLTIESDEKVNKVEVYTLNGELTTSFENEKRIDVAYLPTGVYTLMFYTEEGVYTQKLIKK